MNEFTLILTAFVAALTGLAGFVIWSHNRDSRNHRKRQD